jgi:ferredoxin-NADP reductase
VSPLAPAPTRARSALRRSVGRALVTGLDALTTPHGIGRYAELVDPTWTRTEARGRVLAVRRQTPGTVTLTVRPNGRWRGFSAGQYLRVGVELDGVRHIRCYSPAGSAHRPGEVELTVKRQEGGRVSSYLYDQAAAGLVLDLSDPDGSFVLPAARPSRLLLVSGGSGITPVMSILRTLCDEDYRGETVFLHYAFTAADVPYAAELEEIAARHPNVRVVRALTDADDGDLAGFFGPAHLATVAPWYAEAETYVCGPAGLMDAVAALWEAEGLTERLHIERFLPAVVPVSSPDGGSAGTVTFARSGRSAPDDGRSLLEQAEAAGLQPEFGCRMGICHSCTRRKISGPVRNLVTGEVCTDPDADVQICVSVPAGDVDLDL